jgi:hypothetical protein
MSMARVLRTGRPLSLDAIQQYTPAVFANEPHESRGPRYMYVPTIEPLQRMLENGWGVWEARQQRSRDSTKDPYTKHMLRLRKLEDFEKTAVGDGVAEVVLINAHDGSAAYYLNAGYFRFICSNGMMAGKSLAGFKVIHSKSSSTSLEVLEAGERVITEKFPIMMEQRERMTSVLLESTQQEGLAERALRLRYGPSVAPFPATDLLHCRRPEDEKPTVWNILNRIQENVLSGGWETRSAYLGRRSAVRPVERVTAVATINAGLWDAALELAA